MLELCLREKMQKAQASLEHVMIITVVEASLMVMNVYVQRSVPGNLNSNMVPFSLSKN